MAIALVFTPASMTAAHYDDVIKRLEAAGAGAPPGRLYHVCFGSGDRLRVVDVWESQETFDAFGRTLMPILIGRPRGAAGPVAVRAGETVEVVGREGLRLRVRRSDAGPVLAKKVGG